MSPGGLVPVKVQHRRRNITGTLKHPSHGDGAAKLQPLSSTLIHSDMHGSTGEPVEAEPGSVMPHTSSNQKCCTFLVGSNNLRFSFNVSETLWMSPPQQL